MSQKKYPMTMEGQETLERTITDMIQNQRPHVIKLIAEARAHGDLSENADYDAAKEKQGFLEARIADLQRRLAQAEVVDVSKIKSDVIVFGAHVKLLDCGLEKKISYQLVGEDEADLKKGKISIFAPLAVALVGKKVGDFIEFRSKEFKILSLEFK